MPPPRAGARPMTQPDAYRAGRGLTLRLTDPRRRRSRAVLLEPHCTKKAARPAPQVPTATAAAPHNAHVYTQAPRPRPQGLPSP